METAMLAGRLAKQLAKRLDGVALPGTLRRATEGEPDIFGNPQPGTPLLFPFKGWRESYEAAWIAAGIPSTDSRILILAATIDTEPAQTDLISFADAWWQIIAVESDPATATYTCQARQTSAPS